MTHRPVQLKQIYGMLNELAAESAAEMRAIKQRFGVVLEKNPLMQDWFLQLFPTERPANVQDTGLMQFSRHGSAIVLPWEIVKFIAKVEEEQTLNPSVNLQLSDSDLDSSSDTDSVVCMGEEEIVAPALNCYSVRSQDSDPESSFSRGHVYADCGQLNSSAMDSSTMLTEADGSDVEITDYTE